MEIYQVRAFVTVAKLGNLTRAAEVLHVTQPAVTAQVKALEEELGVALFDRQPGRIAITRAGQALLAPAEQLLVTASHLQGQARALQGEITGQFVLGTVSDPDSLRLGSLLGVLVKSLPLLEVRTRSGLAEELREHVATGGLHAAFYIGPHMPREAAGLTLQTQHYRVVGPAAMRAHILRAGWRDLAALPWVGAPAQHHVQTLLRDLFARQGLVHRQVVEVDGTASPLGLVRAGVGLALLREDTALPAAEQGELVVWPHTRVGAQLCFIHPRAAEHDPATVAALSALRGVWGLR